MKQGTTNRDQFYIATILAIVLAIFAVAFFFWWPLLAYSWKHWLG